MTQSKLFSTTFAAGAGDCIPFFTLGTILHLLVLIEQLKTIQRQR